MSGAGLGIALHAGDGPGTHAGREDAPVAVPARRVLDRDAGAGVACRVPNSIACDRIGLGVRTRRPARAVQATVGGRSFQLDDRIWSDRPRRGLRHAFVGFLQPAGLRRLGVRTEGGDHWTGVRPLHLRVRLLITAADSTLMTTVVTVSLSPGWG